MTNRSPKLLKWPFVLADVLLLAACAWSITKLLPYRDTGAYVVVSIAVLGWIVGAFICIWPWLAEFKAESQQLQSDTLADALKQIERLEDVGSRVQAASSNWQSAQDASARVVQAAKEIEERIKTDSREFMEFAERISADEKQNLRLEVEKLRRNEAEWLQVAARMLDHTFALTVAAVRSGQPNLATQMTAFQTACRDAARRVGLVPFHPTVGDAFDDRSQQPEDADGKAEPGAVVSDVLATGFTLQGQLLRKALVRVSTAGPGTQSAAIASNAQNDLEPKSEDVEQSTIAEEAEESRVQSPVADEPVADEQTEPDIAEPERAVAESEPAETEEEPVDEAAVEETFAREPLSPEPGSQRLQEPLASEVPTREVPVFKDSPEPSSEIITPEEDQPRRRQRKPDPQSTLPF